MRKVHQVENDTQGSFPIPQGPYSNGKKSPPGGAGRDMKKKKSQLQVRPTQIACDVYFVSSSQPMVINRLC